MAAAAAGSNGGEANPDGADDPATRIACYVCSSAADPMDGIWVGCSGCETWCHQHCNDVLRGKESQELEGLLWWCASCKGNLCTPSEALKHVPRISMCAFCAVCSTSQ